MQICKVCHYEDYSLIPPQEINIINSHMLTMVVLVVLKMFADHTNIQTEIAIHITTLGKVLFIVNIFNFFISLGS